MLSTPTPKNFAASRVPYNLSSSRMMGLSSCCFLIGWLSSFVSCEYRLRIDPLRGGEPVQGVADLGQADAVVPDLQFDGVGAVGVERPPGADQQIDAVGRSVGGAADDLAGER